MTIREAVVKAALECGFSSESVARCIQRADWIVPEGKAGGDTEIPAGLEQIVIEAFKLKYTSTITNPGAIRDAIETLENAARKN